MEQEKICIATLFLQEDGSSFQSTLLHPERSLTLDKLFDMAKETLDIGSEIELQAEVQLRLPDEKVIGRQILCGNHLII